MQNKLEVMKGMISLSFPALSIIYDVLSVFEARDEVYFCVFKGIDLFV